MSEKLNRLYGGISDSKMLEEAQTIHGALLLDLTDFTNFDADLANAPTALQNAITAAVDVPTDETVMDLIQETTDEVNEKWTDCKNKFQDTKYFIEKAFPKERSKWNEFGYDDYDEMSAKQDKVNGFMTQFSKACNKYKTELIAQNYSQAKIDEFIALRDAFNTANGNQNEAIKQRGTQTQDRIKLYNHVWRILQRISKASKSIYRNNFEKLKVYLLPAGGTNEDGTDLSILLHVKDKATHTALADSEGLLVEKDLTENADDNGNLAFPKLEDGDYTVKVSAPGHTQQDVPIHIEGGGLVETDVNLE